MYIPFCRCKLSEFLISCVTCFSCVVLLTSSLFFFLYFMVVCGHWSKVGIDCVIRKRKKKKAYISFCVLPTGRPVPVHFASVTSSTPHIPFASFHLWFMGCPSIFLAFFIFFFLWSFPFLFHFLQLLSICFVHLIYQCSWKTRSQSLGFSQAFSLLSEHLYWHIPICFPLHWQEHATVRFSTQLIKHFLDTKQ